MDQPERDANRLVMNDGCWSDLDLATAHLLASFRAGVPVGLPDDVISRLPRLSAPEFLFFRYVVGRLMSRNAGGQETRILSWGYDPEIAWMSRAFPDHDSWHATVLEHRLSIRHDVRTSVGSNVGIPLVFVVKSNGTLNQAEIRHYLEWPVRFEQRYDLVVVQPDCLAPDECLTRIPDVLEPYGVAISLRSSEWEPGPLLSDRGLESWDVPGTRWLAYTRRDPSMVSEYRYRPPPAWPHSMTTVEWLLNDSRSNQFRIQPSADAKRFRPVEEPTADE